MARTVRKPSLYEIIYEGVRKIPKGKVATYGEVARHCGLREHARLVGYALHNLPANSGVPWHRVINSKGEISLPRESGSYELQRSLLESEGIRFSGNRIDLLKYGVAAGAGQANRPHGIKKRRNKKS